MSETSSDLPNGGDGARAAPPPARGASARGARHAVRPRRAPATAVGRWLCGTVPLRVPSARGARRGRARGARRARGTVRALASAGRAARRDPAVARAIAGQGRGRPGAGSCGRPERECREARRAAHAARAAASARSGHRRARMRGREPAPFRGGAHEKVARPLHGRARPARAAHAALWPAGRRHGGPAGGWRAAPAVLRPGVRRVHRSRGLLLGGLCRAGACPSCPLFFPPRCLCTRVH